MLNLEEILEKKLVRPECGESPVAPPVPEYSSAVLFLGLVCPARRQADKMCVRTSVVIRLEHLVHLVMCNVCVFEELKTSTVLTIENQKRP